MVARQPQKRNRILIDEITKSSFSLIVSLFNDVVGVLKDLEDVSSSEAEGETAKLVPEF